MRYFNTFGGNYYSMGVLLCLISASTLIASSSRARFDPLGTCCSRFFLSEEGKVKPEQFELCAFLESTLSRLYLVIYFGEFLPRKESACRIIINKMVPELVQLDRLMSRSI